MGVQAMAPAFADSCKHLRLAGVLAAVALASSCAASHSPQQVRAQNPSVTYTYSGDEELLRAAQNAGTFCSQYNSTPGPARIVTDTNGVRSAIFECGPRTTVPVVVAQPTAPAVVAQPAVVPNLSYSYRTDEELLSAARTAQTYCTNSNSLAVVSTITPNTDGSKTVAFQCRV
jgi:hypothetical protein